MKNSALILVLLLAILAMGITQDLGQADRGKVARGAVLKGGKFQSNGGVSTVQTTSRAREYRQSSPRIIFPGVRRLVPGEYPTIQAAIDACVDGDTVLISEGTYLENIRYKGKAITVASLYLVDGDTIHIANTIIDASQPSDPDSGSVVYFINGEDTTSVLCGLTIRGGTGTIFSYAGISYRYGGGVLLETAGGRLTRNIISHNRLIAASAFGGGISALCITNNAPYLIMEGNRVTDNFVQSVSSIGDNYGSSGGADLTGVSARIIENVFERNTVIAANFVECGGLGLFQNPITPLVPTAYIKNNILRENIIIATNSDAVGAGIFLSVTTEVTILGNLFENNMATSTSGSAYGGGIYIEESSFRLENNIITRNSAKNYGGGVNVEGYPQQGNEQAIINNTFFDNNATNYGGGLSIRNGANVVAFNNILWADSATTGSEVYVSGGTAYVRYSDIQGGYAGTGNINSNPYFVNGSFNLTDSSACVGAGIDSIQIVANWYYCPGTDYQGFARPNPVDSYVDIGALESPFAKVTGIAEEGIAIPFKYSLSHNYPNPFNPVTTIEYQLPQVSHVDLSIYNLLGQKVATLVSAKQPAGRYSVTWDATGFSSGVYYYRLESGNGFIQTRKLVLIK
jgi:hypothetical protein